MTFIRPDGRSFKKLVKASALSREPLLAPMNRKVSVFDLPDDILNDIFTLLSIQCKQQAVQLTCKRWWQLLQNPRPGLWGDVTLNLDTHRQLLGRSRTTFRPAGYSCLLVSVLCLGLDLQTRAQSLTLVRDSPRTAWLTLSNVFTTFGCLPHYSNH